MAGLGLDSGAASGHSPFMSLFPEDAPYRVLARKYRPAAFDALIGQDAVVQTLANAIARNRLAQAWLLTGVRGVGKTSTARIIAKALNCTGADGSGGPTIAPCGVCDACVGIAAGQHIDVVEMDAASNTGVDDIREIIESVRYATVSARYKVHIIDEVHMLSKNAFNALLKTLEEPPPHVKFIFATTEVGKVPATILSRCQRFDLKRVPHDLLARHFAKVAEAEQVLADADALALIARAAEGSVRDGLSILDQAIALSGERVTADAVREMLGLADRGRTARLLGALLEADAAAGLSAVQDAHDAGVEPHALFAELLDMVHALARAKLSGEADLSLPDADRALIAGWAAQMGFPGIHRLWQLLLKGLGEIREAPQPRQAADMAVLRICHAGGMPDPERLARLLQQGSAPEAVAKTAGPISSGQPVANLAPVGARLADFRALVQLFEDQREALLVKQLTDDVALVRFAHGELELAPLRPLPASFAAEVARHVSGWTQQSWQVKLTEPTGGSSLRQEAEARAQSAREAALKDPLVEAFLATFPGSELMAVAEPTAMKRSA